MGSIMGDGVMEMVELLANGLVEQFLDICFGTMPHDSFDVPFFLFI